MAMIWNPMTLDHHTKMVCADYHDYVRKRLMKSKVIIIILMVDYGVND